MVRLGDSVIRLVELETSQVCRGHCKDSVHEISMLDGFSKSNSKSMRKTEQTSRANVTARLLYAGRTAEGPSVQYVEISK